MTKADTMEQSMHLEKEKDAPDAELASQVPIPTGYRLLCMVPDIESVTPGGIIKAEETIEAEQLMATVLFVLKIGPDAYKDPKRFPSGPWCKEGDFILTRPHAGSRIKVHGREFRVLNDDSVEAVVEDPRGVKRA